MESVDLDSIAVLIDPGCLPKVFGIYCHLASQSYGGRDAMEYKEWCTIMQGTFYVLMDNEYRSNFLD